jgi:hypothetical protein
MPKLQITKAGKAKDFFQMNSQLSQQEINAVVCCNLATHTD